MLARFHYFRFLYFMEQVISANSCLYVVFIKLILD